MQEADEYSEYDKHTICSMCRNVRCELDNSCSEFKDWSISQMEDFIKHRRSLDNECTKRVEAGPSTSSNSDANPESMKLFEEKIFSKVGEIISSMIGKFLVRMS